MANLVKYALFLAADAAIIGCVVHFFVRMLHSHRPIDWPDLPTLPPLPAAPFRRAVRDSHAFDPFYSRRILIPSCLAIQVLVCDRWAVALRSM